ncbi:MAG: M15 family metallopeptidase [Candidatus Improbicoccus pseudotrichonymphae]|uniref:M15 family metallopeptidase n=1 Tax=Candidatus Improbicoccus pseudotrichonymphae TaxID=3033792 RepID=A0AA48HUU9_9FIRM|nr:MAG: M15 family metallopeptidase [Candidatus Improbicoccus pseudotrichonymphae]
MKIVSKFKLRNVFLCITALVLMFFLFNITTVNSSFGEGFSCEEVTKEFENKMNQNETFRNNEHIRCSDLKIVKFKRFGYDGETHYGEIVVNAEIAEEVLEILSELYEAKYYIDTISCFEFRNIADTDVLSQHAFGKAIDINDFQNPCFIIDEKTGKVIKTIPANLERYSDRNLGEVGIIKPHDACYDAFKKRDWEWGGEWTHPIDYMHFQKHAWNAPKPEPKYKKTTGGQDSKINEQKPN